MSPGIVVPGMPGGGAIVAWKAWSNQEIYSQRISPDGLPVAGVSQSQRTRQQSLQISVTPNPSTDAVRIGVAGISSRHPGADVFDIRGRRLCGLVGFALPDGSMTYSWNGVTDSGTRAGAGLYFLRLRGESRPIRATIQRLR
jgi:hypothetical protein